MTLVTRAAAPLAASMAVLLAEALLFTGCGGASFAFTTITPAQLYAAGVTLSNAQAPVPATAVSASAAAQVAKEMDNSAVKEVHYMHCVNTFVRPQINQDCYAVSIDPTNAPILGAPNLPTTSRPATWELVMVDPSGHVIDDTGGSN